MIYRVNSVNNALWAPPRLVSAENAPEAAHKYLDFALPFAAAQREAKYELTTMEVSGLVDTGAVLFEVWCQITPQERPAYPQCSTLYVLPEEVLS